MCQLAGVSRASYYRHWEVVAPDEAEMAVRVAIQEVSLTHRRRYGYRRPVPGKGTRREDHALFIVRDEFRPAIP